jgi:hypothetical protein
MAAGLIAVAALAVGTETGPWVMLAILAVPIGVTVRDLVMRMSDWRWQQEWFEEREVIIGADLLGAIDRTRTPSGFYRMVSMAGRRGLLQDGGGRWLLSDLIAAIEVEQRVVGSGRSLKGLLPPGVRTPAAHAVASWLTRAFEPSGKGLTYSASPKWQDRRFEEWFPRHLQRRGLALSRLATADSVDELLRALESCLRNGQGRAEGQEAA